MHRKTLWLATLSVATLALAAPLSAQTRIELEGPITAVKGTVIEIFGGLVSFEAAGAEVETDDENFRNISDLKIGADIEVDAELAADGSIRAKRLEVSDEKDPDTEVGGVITAVDEAAGSFHIGPVVVYFDGSTRLKKLTAIQAGTLVEATVTVGDRLQARLVELEEADD